MLSTLVLLPVAFLPWTIEVYIVPKAALLWVLTFGATAAVVVGDLRQGRLVVADGPGVRALVIFCLAAVAGTVGSPSPLVSLLGAFMRREGLLSLIAYALVYLLILRLATTKRRTEFGVWMLIIPVLPTGLYAVAQSFGFELVRELNPSGAAVRAYGMLGNADFLGIYSALMMPVLAIAFVKSRGWRRAYIGVSLLLDVMASLLAYSRGGWLGAAVGLVLLGALLGREGARRHVWGIAAAVAIMVLGAAVSFGLRGAQSKPPQTGFVQHAATTVELGSGTAATRLEIWPRVLPIVARRPLFGFGPEAFRGQFMPVRGARLVALEGTVRWDRPHNSLLYLAAATGLVGLGAYLVFLGAAIGAVVRARYAGSGKGGLSLGLVSGAVGAIVAEFFVLWSPATTPLIFAALGLAVVSASAKGYECVSFRDLRVPAWGRIAGVGIAAIVLAGVFWAAVQSVRADYYADLGRLALKNGRRADSITYYDRAVATSPWINDYRWRAARGWTQAGFLSRNTGYLETAAHILMTGLRFDPFDEQSEAQLGEAYRYMSTAGGANTMGRAVSAYRKALNLDPFSTVAAGGLAHVYFLEKDYTHSLAQARRVLGWDPANQDMLMLAGYACEQLGRKIQARGYFQKALELQPAFAPARSALRRLSP